MHEKDGFTPAMIPNFEVVYFQKFSLKAAIILLHSLWIFKKCLDMNTLILSMNYHNPENFLLKNFHGRKKYEN